MRSRRFAEFHDKNPRFRRWFYRIDEWIRYTQLAFLIVYMIPLILIVFVSFFTLPDDIRTPLTSLIIAIASVVIIPLMLEKKKVLREQYRQNIPIYEKLIAAIMSSIKDGNIISDECNTAFVEFVQKNVVEIHLNFSIALLNDIAMILLESSKTGDQKRLKKHVTSCINIMRKQGGAQKTFCFNRYILEPINMEESSDKSDKKII